MLQLGSTGTATVDTASNTISIDGSPTDNTISGFNNFALDTNDMFVAGGGDYRVTFAPDPDTLVFTPGSGNVILSGITSTNFLLDFKGFSPSFDATALAGDTDTSTGSTVITLSPTSMITLQGYTGGIAPGNLLFELACYAEGTRIATPDGEVAIEQLKIGDVVLTASGGVRPVRWLGHRRVDLRHHPRPAAVEPVRVREGAFGDGLPRRDLWLSPCHAIAVDGGLIPVGALINGRTIAQEPRDAVTYWHVELDAHDLILAEGLPCESYLDTGNRSGFETTDRPMDLHPDFSPRDPEHRRRYSCLPLMAADQIEPVWRRLAARAAALGRPVSLPAATTDPELRLLVNGCEVRPAEVAANRVLFVLPPQTRTIHIASRSCAPSDLQPWLDDRRRLGVAVHRIIFHGRQDRTELAMDHPSLTTGWHDPECNGVKLWRWTDGAAALPVPGDTMMVEIRFSGAAYVVPAEIGRSKGQRAA